MQKEIVIDTFSVDDCGYYQIYYTGKRFYFTLIPSFNRLKKQYGQSALFYVDDEIMDDVGYNKDPFKTIGRVIDSVATYINQSHYDNHRDDINHFSFLSSTKRKDNIYGHYAKKIIQKLNGDWVYYCDDDGGFYFCKNTKTP